MAHKNTCVVYTCITNGYDNLIRHKFSAPDWDYVCFTDNAKLLKRGRVGRWQIRPLAYDKSDNTRNARWHKTHPHILFPDYQASLWIDSNGEILTPHVFDLVSRAGKSMLIPYHFSRDCVFDEAVEVVLCRKDTPENVNNMVFVLETNKMPRHYGLNETNVIYRHHNDAKIMELMNVWWDFIEKYSKRDQLSLSYVLWCANISVADISFNNARMDTVNFRFITHTSESRGSRKWFGKVRCADNRRRIYFCGICVFSYTRH